MHRANTIEPPPRQGAVSPWVEISAWILAFGILLAAQCAPERPTSVAAGRMETAAAPVTAVSAQPGAPRRPR
jgi:hypothetical protein